MVPLAPVMEYLGAQVSYGRQDHSVSISMDGSTLYHQIGTAQLTVSGGGEGACCPSAWPHAAREAAAAMASKRERNFFTETASLFLPRRTSRRFLFSL